MKNTAFSLMTALLAVMNESEPKDPYYVLAQYFLYHFDQLRDLNIYDVADACYVSRSGIRRFCQSIGFDNFSDLKAEADEWKRQCNYFIGYSVRPSRRRQGYAVEMLRLGLAECRKLGIDRVLLTCDKTNIGSAKTIQHNGGILENEIQTPDRITQRYWIAL